MHAFQQQQSMQPYIAFGMVLRRLFHAFHSCHFRQDDRQQTAAVEQFEPAARAAFGEDTRQFVADPLGGDGADEGMVSLDGSESARIDFEFQARGEADRAQEAEMILAENAPPGCRWRGLRGVPGRRGPPRSRARCRSRDPSADR